MGSSRGAAEEFLEAVTHVQQRSAGIEDPFRRGHQIGFAADQSRVENSVVSLNKE